MRAWSFEGLSPVERRAFRNYERRLSDPSTAMSPQDWKASKDTWGRGTNHRFITPRAALPLHSDRIQIEQPPDPELTAAEIIAQSKIQFTKQKEHEEAISCISAKIPVAGPIGILFFGDPHLDDGGTDWFALERDMDLVKTTEGLYAANIGDTTNNWIGRLVAQHASQSVTARQAWTLAEHFIGELAGKWIFHVGGNHDGWSGDRDPIRYLCRDAGALYLPCEARVKLRFPVGTDLIVNARHDFSGNSMWNTAHAPNRAFTMGFRDEIMICGHKHKSGYNILKAPEGTVGHAIQIASYKMYDRYAKEKGFRDQTLSPCCLTVIDPQAVDPVDRVQVFWNPVRGADYLKHLRGSK